LYHRSSSWARQSWPTSPIRQGINREVAAEIVQSLEAALDRFRNVANALGEGPI
jgi:hypothetical protein